MRTLLLLLTLIRSIVLVGQIDSADKALIWSLIQKEQVNNQITYAEGVSAEILNLLNFHLNRDQIVGMDETRRTVSMVLKTRDKKHIQFKLDNLKLFKWTNDLFAHSNMIPADSIWEYVAIRNNQFKDIYLSAVSRIDTSITNNLISERTKYCTIFQFAPPIYLQNRKLCIFLMQRICGNHCGSQELDLYKLENGQYIKWLHIAGWVY